MNKLRSIVLVLILSLVAIFAQGTLLKLFAPSATIVPNLLLLVVGFLAFYEVSIFGSILAFGMGLVLDLSSGVLLGPWAAAFVSVYGMLSALSQRLFVESFLASFVALFFSSLLASFVFLVLMLQFQPALSQRLSLSWLMLVEAFMTGILAPAAFWGLRRLMFAKVAGGGRGGF